MPAVATAEPKQQARNQSLQDNTAVLDSPEKESESENTAKNQHTEQNTVAPNPATDITMAGNSAVTPVTASADRAAPVTANPKQPGLAVKTEAALEPGLEEKTEETGYSII